ncbi:hypothetical protein Csa_022493 [Cucumis sativus]|uniref:Uncharacterized protein n=1 Tax=Cucumis sativus TaxID=3659 RepID=A0A0A0LQE9_CUCSA|nr:hypothetical protein Csa_022493 [Cucumis sativus]
MGNICFKSNKVMAQDDSYDDFPPHHLIEPKKVQQQPLPGSAMAKPKNGTGGAAGKKVVRFNLQEEEKDEEGRNSGDSGPGVLRIKVVISQKELKQILKSRENNSCSLEELIEELKVKGRATTVSADETGSWKPALECIPEGESTLMN